MTLIFNMGVWFKMWVRSIFIYICFAVLSVFFCLFFLRVSSSMPMFQRQQKPFQWMQHHYAYVSIFLWLSSSTRKIWRGICIFVVDFLTADGRVCLCEYVGFCIHLNNIMFRCSRVYAILVSNHYLMVSFDTENSNHNAYIWNCI